MPAKAGIQRVCTHFPDPCLRGNDETGFRPAKSLNLGTEGPGSVEKRRVQVFGIGPNGVNSDRGASQDDEFA